MTELNNFDEYKIHGKPIHCINNNLFNFGNVFFILCLLNIFNARIMFIYLYFIKYIWWWNYVFLFFVLLNILNDGITIFYSLFNKCLGNFLFRRYKFFQSHFCLFADSRKKKWNLASHSLYLPMFATALSVF